MTTPDAKPASKKNPGTSSDVTALAAGKVERAPLYSSVAHAIEARQKARIVTAGRIVDAPPNALKLMYGGGAGAVGWKALAALAELEPILLIVGKPAPPRVTSAVLALIEKHVRMEACFTDYVVWLPGGVKNPSVDRLNASINSSPHLCLTGYILDPEGQPCIIVGHSD